MRFLSLWRTAQRASVARALAPHWGALVILALFLISGLAILDDYGITWDEPTQRQSVRASLQYVAQGDLRIFRDVATFDVDKFYGMGFESILVLSERAFGLNDDRNVYLSRHLLIHLFFLFCGVFAYFLVYGLFRNRLIALFAMPLFLLHPRLYAHSFFNGKDIPFFGMFIVTLFLAHRAFKKDTVMAFALLGAGVGALTHLRIMGVMLFAAVFAMRALDFVFAQGWEERKRVAAATGAFALTGALTVYALLPYLWGAPIERVVEWWTTLSDHQWDVYELFQGTLYHSADFPADYVVVWFSITAAPFALLLGLAGAGAAVGGAAAAPARALRNTRLRFACLALACFALPALSVILLGSNIFNGWRHLYFLWAPFSLTAVFGLHWALSSLKRERLKAAVYGAFGAGIATTLISMALIHPNQQVSFNFFVDRVTPEQLRAQYVMDYWRHPLRQALEWLLEQDPNPAVSAHSRSLTRGDLIKRNWAILPEQDRDRISLSARLDALVLAHEPHIDERRTPSERTVHAIKVYNNTLLAVEEKQDLEAVYERVMAKEPGIHSIFDVYIEDDSLVYVKDPCFDTDTALSIRSHFILQFIPQNRANLLDEKERTGFEHTWFRFPGYGAQFDGKCVASVPLPYPITAFRTGQVWRQRDLLWDAEFHPIAYREAYDRFRVEQPDARSVFDVHVADGELIYLKEPCAPADREGRFFLHVVPERADDLPMERQAFGFVKFAFPFFLNGTNYSSGCAALYPLPDYPVAAARTGQRTEDGDDLWSATIWLNLEPYRTAYRRAVSGAPRARSVYDVYLTSGELTYVNDSCDQAGTDDKFFLHVTPERADDLPGDRRTHGFYNLDFDFFSNGALLDDKCVAAVPLPEYPIASIRTGQFVSGEGQIWSAEFEVGETRPPPQWN